ncbi:MAG: type II/IV secretion system protein [Planctomycetaceae bacterium]|nr:MAG: type II/IV secretion system protein [Planctomycetaceae bacterium]
METSKQSEALDLDRVRIDPSCAMKIPATLALRRQVLPFAVVDGHAYVACLNPDDRNAMQAVERALQLPVRPQLAEPDSLRRALERMFGDGTSAAGPAAGPRPGRPADRRRSGETESEDAVALCDDVLRSAVMRQASDIHIDPMKEAVRIRFRTDGVLDEYRQLPVAAQSGLVSRLKVLAGMDIAEKRAPQDGRFTYQAGGGSQMVDIRAATLPTKYGERMTLRLLALQTDSLTLERLGMAPEDLACFTEAIQKPHGLILLSGPTGSGKSTSLYAAVRRLIGQRDLNVVTIEDPIEYDISGVAQVEVDSADKVSFAKALRSVLRHDPDVVMIGEIRDGETADIAIKAALTGHLVFSTLHTNSAASAVTRLIDMGVARYLVAATLRLVVAQRLVRLSCEHCRQEIELTSQWAQLLGDPSLAGRTVYQPSGCMYCANRGFVGRLGLFEMMPVDASLSRLIAEGAGEVEIMGEMQRRGATRLIDDALRKLIAGDTVTEDVVRAVTVW